MFSIAAARDANVLGIRGTFSAKTLQCSRSPSNFRFLYKWIQCKIIFKTFGSITKKAHERGFIRRFAIINENKSSGKDYTDTPTKYRSLYHKSISYLKSASPLSPTKMLKNWIFASDISIAVSRPQISLPSLACSDSSHRRR